MNEVTLKLVIKRADAGHCSLAFFREGTGDDMVEERADQMEAAYRAAVQALLEQCGGKMTIPHMDSIYLDFLEAHTKSLELADGEYLRFGDLREAIRKAMRTLGDK